MAKKKTISLESASAMDCVSALRSALSVKDSGRSVMDLSSHRSFVGVPIPSIAVQWVLNSNVLPLGRMVEFAGAPECCKSTFLYEVMGWFLRQGGHVVLVETEQKDNSQIRHAVLKYDADGISRVVVKQSLSYEEWVEALKDASLFYAEWQKTHGEQFPVLFCIDSLAAAPQDKRIAEMKENGHTNVGYGGIARALSQDLQTFSSIQAGHPFTFAFTNHLKQSMNSMGLPTEYRSGGKAPEFYESVSFRFAPAPQTRFTKMDCAGRKLRLSTSKNSIGPTKREVEILVYFRNLPNPNYDPTDAYSDRYLLDVSFDWGEVDIKFLTAICNGSRDEFSAPRRRMFSELLDLHVVSKKNSPTWVWSSVLGVPESDPVSFSDAGKLLMANEDLLRRLQEELYIQRRPIFGAGDNYDEMMDAFTRSSEERAIALNNRNYIENTEKNNE